MGIVARALAFLALPVALAAGVAAAQTGAPAAPAVRGGVGQQTPLDASAVRAAIARALRAAPRGFEALAAPAQTGVRVVGADVEPTGPRRRRVTIDLSQKTLTYDPSGEVEALLDDVIRSTAALTAGAGDVEYRFLVDGLPLDRLVRGGAGSGGRRLQAHGSGPIVPRQRRPPRRALPTSRRPRRPRRAPRLGGARRLSV